MKNKKSRFGLTEEDLNKLIPVFKSYPKINDVILFGSRAKGCEKPGSDVDLALKGDKLNSDDVQNLHIILDELYLPYKFDIVILEYIKERELLEHIRRVGISLLNRGMSIQNF